MGEVVEGDSVYHTQPVDSEWSLDMNVEEAMEATFDNYQTWTGDNVPAKPEQVHKNTVLNKNSTGMTIEEAYVAYDMRESYLQRHASPMARYSDATDLTTKEFSTKTRNMWQTDELGLYPESTRICE